MLDTRASKMSRHRSHRDIEELLGVYALDVLDDEERDVVDRHLGHCLRCHEEVAGHREAVAALIAGGPFPTGIWNRIAAAVEEPPPMLAPVARLSPRRARPLRWLGGVAAVAAAAVAFLGIRLVDQERRPDRPQTTMAVDAGLWRSAFADPASQTLQLQSADRPAVAQAAIFPDGRGYLLADQLPSLGSGRSYQLWVLVDHERVSAGILGGRPTIAAFHVDQRVEGLAITDEQAGGVVVSENAPVVFGRIGQS